MLGPATVARRVNSWLDGRTEDLGDTGCALALGAGGSRAAGAIGTNSLARTDGWNESASGRPDQYSPALIVSVTP